jgi:hypothetical protein
VQWKTIPEITWELATEGIVTFFERSRGSKEDPRLRDYLEGQRERCEHGICRKYSKYEKVFSG